MEKKCVQRRDFIEGEYLYSVLIVSKFEKTKTLNKQQERALWTFMSRIDVFAKWVWKMSFETLWQFTWQPGTILKVLDTRQSRMNFEILASYPTFSVRCVPTAYRFKAPFTAR